MKMNKILAGLLVAGVCGAGITVMASGNDGSQNTKGGTKPVVEVKPVNVEKDGTNIAGKEKAAEIEKYIASKYGENWAVDLFNLHGDNWDDILENELEMHFGYKFDDIIEDIIEAKERAAGLDIDDNDDRDDLDDNDDLYDDQDDDNDDLYDDDRDDLDDNDDLDDDQDDDNDDSDDDQDND